MSRKNWFLFSLLISIGLRVHMAMHGELAHPLICMTVSVMLLAFILPVIFPVAAIEQFLFHFAPWQGAGHLQITIIVMIAAAAFVWFCPGRVQRWFGVFNPFGEGKRRRPSLTRGVAHIFDLLNKRLFGRQKTGGWA